MNQLYFLPSASILVLLHRIQRQWGQPLLTRPTSIVKAIEFQH